MAKSRHIPPGKMAESRQIPPEKMAKSRQITSGKMVKSRKIPPSTNFVKGIAFTLKASTADYYDAETSS